MQPTAERTKILGQKDVAMGGKGLRITAPLLRQILSMLRRVERHPVRAIHTMRSADPAPHALQLLAPACAIALHFTERIATHHELWIETRLHELPCRVTEHGVVNPLQHAGDEGCAFLFAHSAGRTALVVAQRAGQSALDNQPAQLCGQAGNLRGRRRPHELPVGSSQDRDYQALKLFHRSIHHHEPAPTAAPCQSPVRSFVGLGTNATDSHSRVHHRHRSKSGFRSIL
jgi:hypothetical protein